MTRPDRQESRSIGILIPTRNCAAFVPGHIESLNSWIDLADEVVVVDSNSKDGTVALLQAGLKHPRIKVLSHPPGLYESWNFGIQNINARHIYIATVGDSITRAGLEHLLEVAEKFQSDVVISKPRFVSEAGQPLPDSRWPINEILDRLQVVRPLLLTPAQQFLFAVTNAWGAILGSSASNLYRTDCLKGRPFPTQFGTSGDGGWGIQNMFDTKIAITPERFSTFRHHEKAYSLAEYRVESLAFKLFRFAQQVIEQQRPHNADLPQILSAVSWPELERALHVSFVKQEKLEAFRADKFPWILRPAAWGARLARDRARKRISQLTDLALQAK